MINILDEILRLKDLEKKLESIKSSKEFHEFLENNAHSSLDSNLILDTEYNKLVDVYVSHLELANKQ